MTERVHYVQDYVQKLAPCRGKKESYLQSYVQVGQYCRESVREDSCTPLALDVSLWWVNYMH